MNTRNPNLILEHLQLCLPRLPLRDHGDMPLVELCLDSIDTVELLCVIHEEFAVRLLESDLAPGQTLHDICAVIAARTPEAARP
jgi:acyl carrier protein